MEAPKCRICGKSEWRHVCEEAAKSIGGKDERVSGASRNKGGDVKGSQKRQRQAEADKGVMVAIRSGVSGGQESKEAGGMGRVGETKKKQGWDREAYNAYQREYMRKRRAK